MLKKIITYTLTVVGLLIIVGALVGTKVLQFSAMAAAGAAFVPPAETVTAAGVTEAVWENSLSVTGSLAAVQGVTIATELASKVVAISFEAGARVKAGDLLIRQDTSTEEAQLGQLEATLALAKINFERNRELLAQKTVSQAEFDASDAQFRQASGAVNNIRALIAKKTIRAPFDGRLGLRLVNLGQSLREGEAIVTLQTLDPIFVNFSLPQQRLPLLAVGGKVRVRSGAADGSAVEGRITAIAPEVDTATRNVRVQATLENGSEKFRPGMFAEVTVLLPPTGANLVIPATAVLYAPFGDSVFVIDEKKNEKSGATEKILRQQFIRLGAAKGDFVVVTTGLKAGEQVVTTGAFKLRPGMAVVIDNTLAPKAELAPKVNEG
jgi:membrane fusion protein (multidrug efflux system)